MNVFLDRFGDTPFGTFGRMTVGEFSCYTIERKWMGNARSISCIPDGTYPLRLRESPIVHRSSGGQHSKGWEVCDVPGRSLIMIHPANRAAELEGCIAPGKSLGCISREWAVLESRVAFSEIMRLLSADQDHQIIIRRDCAEY